ncbi:MAG: stage III sporulation protein AC/AD protein family [Clostridiales bacterium]|nr:stage III sporulation protein AC/AD protein family [Clostridiales bacterium]
MNIFALAGIGITAAVIAIIIKQYKPEIAMLVSVMAGIVILTVAISVVAPVLKTISELTGMAGLDSTYANALLKALAIVYITQLASDNCRDVGEAAIAAKLELAGKIAVILISMPMFEGIINLVMKLLS